jgi:hypothetical protein
MGLLQAGEGLAHLTSDIRQDVLNEDLTVVALPDSLMSGTRRPQPEKRIDRRVAAYMTRRIAPSRDVPAAVMDCVQTSFAPATLRVLQSSVVVFLHHSL